ncbi:cytochrome C oxidase subunit II [Pseudalkalibacillus decolorationis]|uniref:cytochrome C oxidase subunit II n=1 Tax=Pseudalkalibacillus decolorationis TaxID=163879 RepID=UPI00214821B0|nr:cytochrome C oxidase subunit II [Pseudalkalibacillus decolorationis]
MGYKQLFMVTIILFVTACTQNIQNEAEQMDDPPVTVIEVSATNWEFNKKVYKVIAGKPVTINFKSEDGYHGLGIKGLENVNIEGEGSTKVIFEPGEYQVYCTIPCGEGHSKMVSTLIAVDINNSKTS